MPSGYPRPLHLRKAAAKARYDKYRRGHPEVFSRASRKFYLKNREKIAAWGRQQYEKNLDAVKARQRAYRERLKNDPDRLQKYRAERHEYYLKRKSLLAQKRCLARREARATGRLQIVSGPEAVRRRVKNMHRRARKLGVIHPEHRKVQSLYLLWLSSPLLV